MIFGGKFIRNNLNFEQNGTNAESNMNGISVLNKEEILFWNKTIEDLEQTDQDLTKALSLIKKHQAIEETLSLANQYCSEAINALEIFPHLNFFVGREDSSPIADLQKTLL